MKLRTWCIRMGQILTKTVLVCTVFLVFLTLFCPQLTKAENDRGGITIRQQNVPIEKVFQSIEKQSGYRFFYNETLLQGAGKVTLNLQNASLQEALEACFRNQPLSYAIVEKTIIVKKRPEQQQSTAPITATVTFSKPGKIIAVRGKVTSNNTPVAGATIMIKGTDNGANTDNEGVFTLPEVEDDATLVVSSVSHAMREIKLNGQAYIAIDLSKQTDDLDEAVVVAYNTTTVKKNTAAVTVIKGEQIQTLPNRSFDKSLQGLVPGLLVTQGTGQPGGGMSNFVLRGIATGGDIKDFQTVRNPLIVVDGIPVFQDPVQSLGSVAPSNNPMAQL
ncbi:MAG TPA: carboxypeptidase-like regulatory domain-containing protein, partial [Niastella sp.]